MKNPLVSILMPCYNHEKFVQIAINSVINQTYKNIELIVIDDGSQDETWAKIKTFEGYPNIFITRQKNLGLIETLKKLREKANGEYLTILASDDRFYPWKIEMMIEELSKYPDATLCTAKTDVIDQNGIVIGKVEGEYDGEDNLYSRLINGDTYISSVSTMVKSSAYLAVKFIDPYIEDLPAWIQISRAGRTTSLRTTVASYRRVPGSLSGNTIKMIDSEMRIIRHFSGRNEDEELPAGWCGRWFKALAGFDAYKAIKFLQSEQCSSEIYFRKDFYKGIVKLFINKLIIKKSSV